MDRRPPTPCPGERARTIAALGPATLLPSTGGAEKVTPLLHHVHSDGAVTALLPEGHELLAAAEAGTTMMAEVVDLAPVPLREPVRGLLWITGWLRAVTGPAARQIALEVAESRPDPRLLDLGHGAAMVRLEPASLVLADPEGSYPVQAADFAASDPDPFRAEEAGWLRHLELSHPDVVGQLGRHLPESLRGGHVRPLGLDRYGLRLRVETYGVEPADHDVRLAFARPIATPSELAGELRRLVGCPFLAGTRP